MTFVKSKKIVIVLTSCALLGACAQRDSSERIAPAMYAVAAATLFMIFNADERP